MMLQVSGDRRIAMRALIAFVLVAALIVALIMTSTSSPSGAVQAQSSTTVSFQNGVSPSASYAGTIDTHLSQNSPTNNAAVALPGMGRRYRGHRPRPHLRASAGQCSGSAAPGRAGRLSGQMSKRGRAGLARRDRPLRF
jgi:hypothetical protein